MSLSNFSVSSSDSITSAEEQTIKDKFSVVQSILNKLDLIEIELRRHKYHRIMVGSKNL